MWQLEIVTLASAKQKPIKKNKIKYRDSNIVIDN